MQQLMETSALTRRPWESGWPQTHRDYDLLLDYVQDRLVWYAYRRLSDLSEAEDVVQEVFVRAYADRDKRANVVMVVPYLYRMLANECAGRLRHTKPLSFESLNLEATAAGQEQTTAVEQNEWIEHLLSRLPDSQAAVIRLRVLEEMSLAEVAKTVGCSLSTAKSRLNYGLRRLRRMVPTLANAARSIEDVTMMHIAANMRTESHENFETIDIHAPLIPVHIWARFREPPKWRVEKERRCIVMDGSSTTLLIDTDLGHLAARNPGANTGMVGWLADLLDVGTLLAREQETAARQGAQVSLERKPDANGRMLTVLTVSAKAMGDYSESDYSRNRSIWEADNVRVYTFDAATQKLEQLRTCVNTAEGPVLVFETTKIDYDEPLDPALFTLDIPSDAAWMEGPHAPPTVRDTSEMTPEGVARAFFEACSRSDWEEAAVFGCYYVNSPKLREWLGGLKLISIGKAFRSGAYPGRFVPYKIELASGEVKEHSLAVRNDHPSAKGQWIVDGGL